MIGALKSIMLSSPVVPEHGRDRRMPTVVILHSQMYRLRQPPVGSVGRTGADSAGTNTESRVHPRGATRSGAYSEPS
ncbi:hypothetical protein GCM10010260_54830 [Streptomyces filipinensis]|uniref:Uncharacterized protein n=1 Tax=Streptomyces filipinensis TaxID=66887 RepID=A0A918MCS5_9ACTN|nr:hypothetical protein GCM10010260_54830 [Streptomyces filipinensis]